MPAPRDLIHETSTSTGTGNLTLAAVNGKVRFSDATHGFGTGGSNVFDYYISNRSAAEWERGTGHMSDANTLVRDTVLASSNSDSAVDFSGGTKDVTNDVPAGVRREVLTGNRTYYVRTDGSDSNDGLTNSSGGAFLTIQKAINVTAALDISIYNVTIDVGDGTYTSGVNVSGPWIGSGSVILRGNTTTPANVVISTTSANAVTVTSYGRLSILGFKVQTTTSGIGVAATNGGVVSVAGLMEYGACATAQLYAERFGIITIASNYTISGGSMNHVRALAFGYVFNVTNTITLSGTPAFTIFANVDRTAQAEFASNTFSGSATGSRYRAFTNGIINTFGGGATYLPGNSAGSIAAQGQYL